MDLRFTDEERAFREEVRAWIDGNLPAETRERMASGRTPTRAMQVDWQKRLYAKGWAVPHWPVEWGGQNWSAIALHPLEEPSTRRRSPTAQCEHARGR